MPNAKTIAARTARNKLPKIPQPKPPSPGSLIWVANGATLKCSLGTAPSKLIVDPSATHEQSEGKWLATILEHVPGKNIQPFGNCKRSSPPPPCSPATPPKWTAVVPTRIAGPKVAPVLAYPGAKLKCNHGGIIEVVEPGQRKKKVDSAKKMTKQQQMRQKIQKHSGNQSQGNVKIENGCIKGNLEQGVANFEGGSLTSEVGAFEFCATPSKLSAEVSAAKFTLANTANTSSASLSVGKLSASAGVNGVSLPSATIAEATITQQLANGVTAEMSAGFGSKVPSFGLK